MVNMKRDWLSLSTGGPPMGASSSNYQREEGEWRERKTRERMDALRRWEEARGACSDKWLSPSVSPHPSYNESSNLWRIKRIRSSTLLSPTATTSFKKPTETEPIIQEDEDNRSKEKVPERLLPFKKRKISSADQEPPSAEPSPLPFKKRKISSAEPSPPSSDQDQDPNNQRPLVDGVPASSPAPPLFLLQKRVTPSDTSRAQHRFQLTLSDIRSSARPLQDLALLAQYANGAAVPVQVQDRTGNAYTMAFKFISSSRTYRFMGPDYTSFLAATQLRAGQTMRISALPSGCNGVPRLAFLHSDAN